MINGEVTNVKATGSDGAAGSGCGGSIVETCVTAGAAMALVCAAALVINRKRKNK